MLISKNTLGSAAVTPASGKTNLFMNEDGVPSVKDSAGAVSTLLTEGEAGDSFQPLNDNLTGLSALTPAADQSAYYNGTTWATYSLAVVGRTFLAATTQAAQRAAIQAVGLVGDEDVLGVKNFVNVATFVQNIRMAHGKLLQWGDGINTWGAMRASNTSVVILSAGQSTPTSVAGQFFFRPMGDTSTVGQSSFDSTAFRFGVMPRPVTDNSISLGEASGRFTAVWAVNATIQTSDARLKTDPRQLRDAEFKAASAIARLPAVWRWIRRVEGDENCEPEGREARKHFGPTVQAAIAVMEAHGLDPFAYSFICYDEWEAEDATYDEDGNETTPARAAGDRYSFRKEELLCFLVAAMARQHDELAERVAALEAKLTA